jgi:ABC-type Fe3+-hydroxamate transport system substrate-binding protein
METIAREAALVDALGVRHAPAGREARIVSLVPSITELVCSLGLSDRLVGRTGFCVHPAHTLRTIPKLGGTKDVNLEALRALRPTHVILNIDENEKPLAEALAGFIPHLVVTHPLAPLDNLALYRLIGGIFGAQAQAEALCARFLAAHQALAREHFATRRVLYLIWKDPWMTVSRDTYLSRTLALAGLRTLPQASPSRYPALGLDEPWLRDTELVLLSSEPYRFRDKHIAEISRIPALAGKPVHLIDGEMTSWYGSRAIGGLDYLRGFARSL